MRYIDADKLALHLSDFALQESPNWGANDHGSADAYEAINECIKAIEQQPTADVVEVVRCKDCVYYDPPHVEDHGKRLEYKDLPKEAFDDLGTGLVSLEYGINVGGRCYRDYNAGYSEDKRIYVSESNYCGRAERTDK